jgi:hypothetical protein
VVTSAPYVVFTLVALVGRLPVRTVTATPRMANRRPCASSSSWARSRVSIGARIVIHLCPKRFFPLRILKDVPGNRAKATSDATPEQSTDLSSAGQTRKFPDFIVECLDKTSGGYEAAHVASYEAAD